MEEHQEIIAQRDDRPYGRGSRSRAIGSLVVRSVLSVLFPPRCLLCQVPGPTARGGLLCPACDEHVSSDCRRPACPKCGATAAPYSIVDGRCRQCRRRRPPINGVVRIGTYGPGLGTLVLRYKYVGHERVGRLMAERLSEAIAAAPWHGEIHAIVPVPTTAWRRVRRTFHAPLELASLLSGYLHLPVVPVLRRVRGGPHQIGLSHRQRIENVRGAFAMRRGIELRGARLLLVDDVATSGATMMECARVLRRADAQAVYVAIMARAERLTTVAATP